MRKYTRDLYARLEAETGLATGFKPVGFIEVAADADRLEEYRRVSAFNRYCGVDVHEISAARGQGAVPARPHRRHPRRLLRRRTTAGSNPVDVTMSLAEGARQQGVTIVEGVPVTGVHARVAARSPASTTAHGDIEAEYVVNCAGMWARQLGATVGRQHPAAGGRALLPHHRADRRASTASWPVLEDPALVRLLPRGGRRADDRPVRAGVRAVARRRHPRGLLVRRAQPRLGPHGPVRREGDEPGADLARHRRQDVLLRPGELHARPRADRRRGARAAQLLRRRRAELDRHPDRRRPRPGARALDRQRPARRRRHRHQHRPAAPATRRTPSTAARARSSRSGMVYQCHYPTRSMQTARGAKLSPLHDRLAARGRVLPRRQRLGGRRLVRRRRASSPTRARCRGGGQNWFDALGEPSTAPRARA